MGERKVIGRAISEVRFFIVLLGLNLNINIAIVLGYCMGATHLRVTTICTHMNI